MIKSMTGYGRGESEGCDRRFTVEVKSVNHRYGDISIKLPRAASALEDRMRRQLSMHIGRGKVDVYVSLESYSRQDINIRLNTAAADSYFEALCELRQRFSLSDEASLQTMASLPDIFSNDKAADNEAAMGEIWVVLSGALSDALRQLDGMRVSEGRHLAEDMAQKTKTLLDLLQQIKLRTPAVAEQYAVRLREKIWEALGGAPQAANPGDPSVFGPTPPAWRTEDISAILEARLLTEIAVYADKSCIDEELTRLESHLCQMGHILTDKESAGSQGDGQYEPLGRKLDFIIQEINREVNTIGSKANDAALSRLVVEMKAEVEKMREQAQNIE